MNNHNSFQELYTLFRIGLVAAFSSLFILSIQAGFVTINVSMICHQSLHTGTGTWAATNTFSIPLGHVLSI